MVQGRQRVLPIRTPGEATCSDVRPSRCHGNRKDIANCFLPPSLSFFCFPYETLVMKSRKKERIKFVRYLRKRDLSIALKWVCKRRFPSPPPSFLNIPHFPTYTIERARHKNVINPWSGHSFGYDFALESRIQLSARSRAESLSRASRRIDRRELPQTRAGDWSPEKESTREVHGVLISRQSSPTFGGVPPGAASWLTHFRSRTDLDS